MIIPAAVKLGEDAILQCTYDQEGDLLYSVKWYKTESEFFRYTPKDNPAIKQFPVDGVRVVESLSNRTQVVLETLSLDSTGEYKCEITVDEPSFYTKEKQGKLEVNT